VAVALKDFGVPGVGILDRHGVGSSFERWPLEMRFITPSFNTTPFRIRDLNAIRLYTSVTNLLGVEHPTRKQYARYLRAVVSAMQLPVLAHSDVAGTVASYGSAVMAYYNGMFLTIFAVGSDIGR